MRNISKSNYLKSKMEMFEAVRETNPDTDKNNNCQEEEDSSDSDSDSDFEERRNLRRRPNRPRFPRRVKKEKKSEIRDCVSWCSGCKVF